VLAGAISWGFKSPSPHHRFKRPDPEWVRPLVFEPLRISNFRSAEIDGFVQILSGDAAQQIVQGVRLLRRLIS
jgi:hypothetical protein